MFNLIIFFYKVNYTFFINKLSICVSTTITLNKIKINYLILITIVLIVFYIKNMNKLGIIFIVSIYWLHIYCIKFLTPFLFGYFKIHPILFYISLIFYTKFLTKTNTSLQFKSNYIILISILSLLLGGIWALYELNWGYYWSTDPIELALTGIILIYLHILHKQLNNEIYRLINFCYIIFYIYIIRSNLIYTKHNFFSNKKLLCIYIKIALHVFIVNYLINNNNKSNHTIITKNFNKITLFFVVWYTLLFNFTHNFLIKKCITVYFMIVLNYKIFTVNWNFLKKPITHWFMLFIIIIFNLYKPQYFLHFLLHNSVNIQTHTLFSKNKLKFLNELFFFEKNSKKNSYNKAVNFFQKKLINTFLLKKNLINYYM